MFKNMKIQVENNLDEIVAELERLNYGGWGINANDKWVGTLFRNKQFTTFATDVCFTDEIPTTLAELKEM